MSEPIPFPKDRSLALMLQAPLTPEAEENMLATVEETLPRLGVDTLVLRILYHFPFSAHPEIAEKDVLSLASARRIAQACRKAGIHLIPKGNLLGHQSDNGGKKPSGLLAAHPELDESPDLAETGYCRSLCPRHPLSAEIIDSVIGEIIEAFEADTFHVGLDEVWEIGRCPRCRDATTAELFAAWVNTLHGMVTRRGCRMAMWSDRLLDPDRFHYTYGKYESGHNGTAAAIESIPRDIVLCDWHYALEPEGQPSARYLTEQGFDVYVCPWTSPEAARQLVGQAPWDSPRMLGVLQTTWCDTGEFCKALQKALAAGGDEAALGALPDDIPHNAARNLLRLAR